MIHISHMCQKNQRKITFVPPENDSHPIIPNVNCLVLQTHESDEYDADTEDNSLCQVVPFANNSFHRQKRSKIKPTSCAKLVTDSEATEIHVRPESPILHNVDELTHLPEVLEYTEYKKVVNTNNQMQFHSLCICPS